MSTRIDRRSFLKVAGGGVAAAAGGAVLRPAPARAQDPRTLVVAWDSDIDTLDPAAFKTNGGYVTIANTNDSMIGWKVQPIESSPAFSRSRPDEFEGLLAESFGHDDGGATLVFKVRPGGEVPERPARHRAFVQVLL